MATKRTKKAKSIIVRPTGKCGESKQNFEGRAYVQMAGGHLQAAERQAISEAGDQAEQRAQSWIRSIVCPARCPLRSSSMETVDGESESEFIKVGARGYTFAEARVVVTAKVRCKPAVKTGVN